MQSSEYITEIFVYHEKIFEPPNVECTFLGMVFLPSGIKYVSEACVFK